MRWRAGADASAALMLVELGEVAVADELGLQMPRRKFSIEANARTRERCKVAWERQGARRRARASWMARKMRGRRQDSGRSVRSARDAGIEGERDAVLAPATALCWCRKCVDDAGGGSWRRRDVYHTGKMSARIHGGFRPKRWWRQARDDVDAMMPRTMIRARWATREGVDDAQWR